MKTINIDVKDETAERYSKLSEERKKLLASMLDRVLTKERNLREIMDDMSQQADNTGLSSEILDEILKKK